MGSHRSVQTHALGVCVPPVGTQPAVGAPVGGEVVDVEARAALAAVVAVLERFGLTAAAPTPPAGPVEAERADGPTPHPRRAAK